VGWGGGVGGWCWSSPHVSGAPFVSERPRREHRANRFFVSASAACVVEGKTARRAYSNIAPPVSNHPTRPDGTKPMGMVLNNSHFLGNGSRFCAGSKPRRLARGGKAAVERSLREVVGHRESKERNTYSLSPPISHLSRFGLLFSGRFHTIATKFSPCFLHHHLAPL
jgi:hypothetical protein